LEAGALDDDVQAADQMLERAKEATRYGKYTGVEYARFADDLVILIDAPRGMTG